MKDFPRFLAKLTEIIEEEIPESEQIIGDDSDSYIPHMHRTMNIPGFSKAPVSITEKLTGTFPSLRNLNLEYDEQDDYIVKRLDRDWQFGPYADLYRRMSAVDPETAATYKHGGVSIADTAILANQENDRLVECLSPYLPAYLFKQFEDDLHCFEIKAPDVLLAFFNNFVFDTFRDFGYRDPAINIEEEFVNMIQVEGNQVSIVFPTLNAILQSANCGQLLIAGHNEADLAKLLTILEPAGKFVDFAA